MTLQDKATAGQVNATAAEIYDAFFVPALFGEWAPRTVHAAGIAAGEAVLDVATGTGAVALAAEAAGARVTAVDINPGMLAVARRKSDRVAWREGAAEALPFGDATFDGALCQFAMMFFEDRARALREMARVTRPGGRIAVTVWDSVRNSPGYRDLIPLIGRIVSQEAEAALRAPFCLGAGDGLPAICAEAGLPPAAIETAEGTARFASLEAWIDTEIGGWTLADMVSTDQLADLKSAARSVLGGHVAPDGAVSFPTRAHLCLIRP